MNLRILLYNCIFKYWSFRRGPLSWEFLSQPTQGSSCILATEVKRTQKLAGTCDQLSFVHKIRQRGPQVWVWQAEDLSYPGPPQVQLHGWTACAVALAPEVRLVLFCHHLKIPQNFIFQIVYGKWSPLGQSSICLKRADKSCHSCLPPSWSSDAPWAQNSGAWLHQDSKWLLRVLLHLRLSKQRHWQPLEARRCFPFKSELDWSPEIRQ